MMNDGILVKLASVADAQALCAYRCRNCEYLAVFEPVRTDDYYTHDGVLHHLQNLEQSMVQGKSVNYVIMDGTNDKVIGVINFSHIMPMPFSACYLGYALDKDYQGRGIMGRSLGVCIDRLFDEKNLHRIMANYLPDNHKSAKVLERLGFVKEGYAKEYLYINGKWQDHIMTALTNPNWH